MWLESWGVPHDFLLKCCAQPAEHKKFSPLRFLNRKSNLSSDWTSPVQEQSLQMILDTWFDAKRDKAKISVSVGTIETVQIFDWDVENKTPP